MKFSFYSLIVTVCLVQLHVTLAQAGPIPQAYYQNERVQDFKNEGTLEKFKLIGKSMRPFALAELVANPKGQRDFDFEQNSISERRLILNRYLKKAPVKTRRKVFKMASLLALEGQDPSLAESITGKGSKRKADITEKLPSQVLTAPTVTKKIDSSCTEDQIKTQFHRALQTLIPYPAPVFQLMSFKEGSCRIDGRLQKTKAGYEFVQNENWSGSESGSLKFHALQELVQLFKATQKTPQAHLLPPVSDPAPQVLTNQPKTQYENISKNPFSVR